MKRWWILLAALLLALCLCASADADSDFSVTIDPGTGYGYISQYNGTSDHVTIPATIDGIRIIGIYDGSFGSSGVKSVTIPNGITDISGNPFFMCESLMKFSVRDDHPTLKIANGALYNKKTDTLLAYPRASTATSYTIPKGTKVIGNSAFYGSRLRKITIPDTVTAIGVAAFCDCTGLTEMTVPDSVQSINILAFYGCSSMVQIYLPAGLERLEDGVLQDCYSLEAIDLPASLKVIGDQAFYMCSSLGDVVLPDGLEVIGDKAFAFCQQFTYIDIPDSVTSIGVNPFVGCTNLYAVNTGASSRWINPTGVLIEAQTGTLICYPCAMQETAYFIGDDVKIIGDEAVSRNPYLQELYICEGVTSLGKELGTFCDALTTVVIAEGVTSMDEYCFRSLKALTSVTLPASLTSISNYCFQYCPNLTLTVPRDSYAAQWAKDNGVQFMYPDSLDWLTN